MTPSAKALVENGSPTAPQFPYASLSSSAVSEGERRLDGETYLTGGYALRLQMQSLRCRPLSRLADIWQPSRLKGTSVSRENGVPFFAATQVFDIRPTPRKWLAPSRTPDLERRFVQPGWILVTCSGTVGEAIIGYEPQRGAIISHDLLRVVPIDELDLGYIYCFLRSRFGKAMLRSSHYGSIVKHLEPEHAFEVPVPDVPRKLRSDLNERIRETYALRDRAYEMTLTAERLFMEAAAPNFEPLTGSTFRVSIKEMLSGRRRFDANHYNPSAAMIEAKLRDSDNGVEALGDVVDDIVLPNRFKRIFMPQGLSYLGSEDIFKVNPTIEKFIPAAAMKDTAKYLVERGWLLVSRSGQTYGLNGSVMLASTWHEGKIISEDVIRVVPGASSPPTGYLQVALSHPVLGRPLMLRLPFGSSVPHIAPGDLATFPLVRLGSTTEREIASLVEDAAEDRAVADRYETAAVATLESFIESLVSTSDEDRSEEESL